VRSVLVELTKVHDEAKSLEVDSKLLTGGKCFLVHSKELCYGIDKEGLVKAKGGSFGAGRVGLLKEASRA